MGKLLYGRIVSIPKIKCIQTARRVGCGFILMFCSFVWVKLLRNMSQNKPVGLHCIMEEGLSLLEVFWATQFSVTHKYVIWPAIYFSTPSSSLAFSLFSAPYLLFSVLPTFMMWRYLSLCMGNWPAKPTPVSELHGKMPPVPLLDISHEWVIPSSKVA